MDNQELSMFYPVFQIIEGKGVLPNISLPRNYKELVAKFYAEDRRGDINQFVSDLEKALAPTKIWAEVRLNWDEIKGLTNISVGSHGGLDLNDNFGMPHFQEHNLSWGNGYVAACVALKYISELLKSA